MNPKKTRTQSQRRAPIDLGDVIGNPRPDGGELPDGILGGAFSRLDPDIPLLLLPVRLETCYNLAADPQELRIRIYPDQVHIDSGQPAPSKGAQAAPTSLTPPREPVARPVLLPQKWLAIGYRDGVQLFSVSGRPVPPTLRTGPVPGAPVVDVSGGDLQVDEGLAWMVDYDKAVEVGMAITVPLSGQAALAKTSVDVLLILGVVDGLEPTAAAAELARLLESHARTDGLDFVPQGTPTNNTETVSSGWTPESPDAAVTAEVERPGPKKGPAADPDSNASELARLLGFSEAGFLSDLAHGADREAAHARELRTALFEAVMGTLIRQILDVNNANAVSPDAMNAVRSWFIHQVTGGAPAPTLRIGPQPYGILPVRRMVAAPDPATTAGQVERIVQLLIDVWRESSYDLPTLDSDLTDEAGDEAVETGLETAIATILATQPHPARLFVRQLEEYIEGSNFFSLHTLYALQIGVMDLAMEPGGYVQGIYEAGSDYYRLLAENYPGGLSSIDDQIDLWKAVEDELNNQHTGETLEKGLAFVDGVLDTLESYEVRQRPLRWLGLDRFEGVMGEDNTKLVAGLLDRESTEWGEAGLVQAPEAAPGSTAADYLADLRRRFEARGPDGALGSTSFSISPRPLLYQLLELTLPLVPNQPVMNENVLEALDELAMLDPTSLEWLLRETLGLGAHRLDAWLTSLASERLGRLRKASPEGIQVGGFGWVTLLEPRRQRRPSQGFIHTPSPAQATTAALLRAGWLAHGSDDPSSPVAVNLDSKRVRSASWLLDGVRQGQALGDLLGYHFERSLHDRLADEAIRPVRKLVLAAGGQPDASPDQPVDGIELLELYRSGGLGELTKPVQNALNDLEAVFDAVNDMSLFEAVHALSGGNFERATAMMDSISTGMIAPPELRAALTPHSAVSVEHRVVVLLRPDAAHPGRGWAAGVRDAIAPALEGWAASLLPPAGEISFSVTGIPNNGKPGSGASLTLQQLELSALDAIYLVGDDPLSVPASLRTLAAGAAGIAGPVSVDPTAANGVTLADFAVLAVELRRLIEALHPLDARDLRPASARGEAGDDPGAALRAIDKLLDEVGVLRGALRDALVKDQVDDIARIVSRFARLGISNGASPQDAPGAADLLGVIERRLANVEAVPIDRADPQPGLEGRLAALLGRRVPVLGQFTLAAAPGEPVVDVTAGPATALEVDDWLDAVGRVRPDVGKLITVGMLSELLGEGGLALNVGQHPLAPGEGWAANHLPAGAGRLSVIALSGPGGPPAVGQLACGLHVDGWSDAVPSTTQVTGVTFQYDAPSSRPPQAWLLAVTPDGEPWNLKLVTDTLLQTLEWVTLRAVGPEDLVDYGRAIPTTFAPGNLVSWPKEATS